LAQYLQINTNRCYSLWHDFIVMWQNKKEKSNKKWYYLHLKSARTAWDGRISELSEDGGCVRYLSLSVIIAPSVPVILYQYLARILSFEFQEKVKETMAGNTLRDNGDRRTGIDRRQFSYDGYLPERRSDEDRRSGFDRRTEER